MITVLRADGEAVAVRFDIRDLGSLVAVDAELVDLFAGVVHERRAVLAFDAQVVEQVGLVHPGLVGVERDRIEVVLRGEQRRAEPCGTAADDCDI